MVLQHVFQLYAQNNIVAEQQDLGMVIPVYNHFAVIGAVKGVPGY